MEDTGIENLFKQLDVLQERFEKICVIYDDEKTKLQKKEKEEDEILSKISNIEKQTKEKQNLLLEQENKILFLKIEEKYWKDLLNKQQQILNEQSESVISIKQQINEDRSKFNEFYNSSLLHHSTVYDKTLTNINTEIQKLTRENNDLMGKIELMEYSIEEYEIKENELKEQQKQLNREYNEIRDENQRILNENTFINSHYNDLFNKYNEIKKQINIFQNKKLSDDQLYSNSKTYKDLIYLEQQSKYANENKSIKYSKQSDVKQQQLVKKYNNMKRKYPSQFQTASDMIKKSKTNNN